MPEDSGGAVGASAGDRAAHLQLTGRQVDTVPRAGVCSLDEAFIRRAPDHFSEEGRTELMAEPDTDTLGSADAARVLRLSAQLQAEAGGATGMPEVPDAREGQALSGYPLARIREAARDAGIADTYVDAALADLRAWQALPQVGRGHPLARKLLGNPPDLVVARRVIAAPADEVLAAMQAVLPGEPYRLTLRDRHGDPQQGGALLFELPGMKHPFERGFAYETNEVGLRHLLVSLRPLEGNSPACELMVHSAVTAHNTGFGVGMALSTLGAAVGGGVLAALGLALGGALGLGAALAPVAGVGGALAGGTLGLKGFRGIYRFAVRRARGALEGLVSAVAARADGSW